MSDLHPDLKRVRSKHQREWGYWIEKKPDGACAAAVCQGPDQGVVSNGIVHAWNGTLAKGIDPDAVEGLLGAAENALNTLVILTNRHSDGKKNALLNKTINVLSAEIEKARL